MSTVPTADVIAVLIGIAVVVMAVAASVASVIIVVAIVLIVAVAVILSHSNCRREGQRQNCSRARQEPSLNRHVTPSVSPQRSSLKKRPRHRHITVGHGRRYSLSFVYFSPLVVSGSEGIAGEPHRQVGECGSSPSRETGECGGGRRSTTKASMPIAFQTVNLISGAKDPLLPRPVRGMPWILVHVGNANLSRFDNGLTIA